MLHVSHAAPEMPRRVKLPHSSTRDRVPDVYIKIIEEIGHQPFGCVSFVGKLHRPGSVLEFAELPRPCIAIERVGFVGIYQRGRKRDCRYILWRFDFTRYEWVEVMSAQSLDQTWTAVFGETAIALLHPRPELVDLISHSHSITDELIQVIDKRLVFEKKDVQQSVLNALYERVAGRIVNCA